MVLNLKIIILINIKSKKNKKNFTINFNIENSKKYFKSFEYLKSVRSGVYLARDLVSEPPNELYPKTYVQEIKNLSKLGLEIEVLDEKNEKIRNELFIRSGTRQ